MTPLYLPVPRPQLRRGRLLFFFAALTALFAAVVVGGIVQVTRYWPALAKDLQNTYVRAWNVPAHRGNILDRNNRPLAMNTDEYNAVAELRQLRGTHSAAEMRALAAALGGALGETAAAMERKLAAEKDFVYLKKNISPRAAARLRRLGARGVWAEYKSRRFYPSGEYWAHLVGYADHSGAGRGGVELLRNAELLPREGRARVLRTSRDEPLRELEFVPAKDGGDWRLSIDSRLQYFAYEALRRAAARHAAESAAAIVMDARTGEILALANYPSFNPNNIAAVDGRLRNRAVADAVEPASTAKPFVAAAALEAGVAGAADVLPTDTPLQIGRLLVRDKHIREELDVAGVLGKSSNIGAVLLAARAGKERLWRLYDALGFGGGEILALPEERGGRLRHYRDWQEEDFATHAYGYGFSTTLLRLLSAYSVFAADGVLRLPSLEAGGGAGGSPGAGRRVLSAAVAVQVRGLLERAVQPGGTGAAAAVAGYRVAGKTGTAFKWDGEKYNAGRVRAFFVGMAPASRPRYVAAVFVDEPRQNGRSGGAAAAPVFREIMRRALLFGGVAPDNLAAEKTTEGGGLL